MDRAEEAARLDRAAIRARLEDWSSAYHGVELAPKTLESLLTWDVSAYARREQDRLAPAYRQPRKEHGGY